MSTRYLFASLQLASAKGSFVSWFNSRSFKMVELANDNVLDTLEPQLGWFHRWFPFLQWSPSSPQALMKAEEELLGSKYIFKSYLKINVKQPCII